MELVPWRNKSYGTRSDRGQRFVDTITSVAETLQRQGQNILGFISKAITAFYSRPIHFT